MPVNCLGTHNKIEDFFFTDVFNKSQQMLQIILDGGTIWHMTQRLSYEVIKSGWHTVFSQALLDLSELSPKLVDGSTDSYIGYGAIPALKYLKRGSNISHEEMVILLRDHPLNVLCLSFADIEHAVCEWRKYVEFTYGIRKLSKRHRY